MASWIENIKKQVYSSYKSHVIVSDKDGLLAYPELQSVLEDEGYKIVLAISGLEVRVKFELEMRGQEGKMLLVAPAGYVPLPDILAEVHHVSLSLQELFPNFDSKALKGLSFDALSLLSKVKIYEQLGYDRTIQFLLENQYGLDLHQLAGNRSKEKVLNALIVVLLERNNVNAALLAYLHNLAKPHFPKLTEVGLSKESLLHYLQAEWKAAIDGEAGEVDFTDPALNKSISFLFVRGILPLHKVTQEKYEALPAKLKVGTTPDAGAEEAELVSLLNYLEQRIGTLQDQHIEWFELMPVLAKAMGKALEVKSTDLPEQLASIVARLNDRFQIFLNNCYESSFTRSGVTRPFIVSRILENIKASTAKKKALIVIDGMSFWQWELIGHQLKSAGVDLQTGTTLSYIPSITAWSRQAIFKGDRPDLAKDSSIEGKLFKEFWKKAGYQDYQIKYEKFGLKHDFAPEELSSAVEILGLVCTDLDDIMHSAIMGDKQLCQSTQQWVEQSNFVALVLKLHQRGFTCFITTDHGNIEAKGVKGLKVGEKVGAPTRSKRHIQYSNEILMNSFVEENPTLKIGKRDQSVYLKDTCAFTTDPKVVTHGGSHMWEVLIPYVKVC